MLLKIALPGNHVVVSIWYICSDVCRGQLSNPEKQYLFCLLPLAYSARFGERALLDIACSPAKARATVSQLSELHQYNPASPRPRSSWRFDALFDIALFEAIAVRSFMYR